MTDTKQLPLARTVVCPLQTSNRKNELVAEKIDSWQEIAARMAELMPSYYESQWEPQIKGRFNVVKREFPTEGHGINGLRNHDAYQALYKVAESFKSYKGNGKPSDENPKGEFGNANYFRLRDNAFNVVKNDDSSYAVEVKIEPYNSEWFKIKSGPYQSEYLDRVINEDDCASTGASEIRLQEDSSLQLNLVVTEDVDVHKPNDVNTLIGIDAGERVVAGVSVVEDGEVETGWLENGSATSGSEFRTKRNELTDKVSRAYENDNLRRVKEVRGYRERYTEHVLDTASKNIVESATEHQPCAIIMEDLTDYRESCDNPIHDWAYNLLQEKIIYKAKAEGIPVDKVEAYNTSTTCNRCRNTDPVARNGVNYDCRRCDYHPHSDINAAINIAQKYNQ